MVRAGALQGFDELVRELGGNSEALRRRRGVATVDPDHLIWLDPVAQLLDDAATLLDSPDFGLRLAARQDARSLGMLAVAIQTAPTIAQAIATASRHLLVHSPAYEVVVDDADPLDAAWAMVRFSVRLEDDTPRRQLVEGCLGYLHRLAFDATRGGYRPRAVSLPHSPLAATDTYRRFFGVPVRFEQPYAAVHIDRERLQDTIASRDPQVQRLAIEHITRGSPAATLRYTDLVRNILVRNLGVDRVTKPATATQLHLHPRALQRRLEREGTSFEKIRSQVHRAAALRYLRDTDLPFTHIAKVLGFSEQSAFTRACNNWFGRSPSAVRKGDGHRASRG